MTPWSMVEPTPKQRLAIEDYEKVTRTKIHCNSKQDAHDVISQFCGDGLTFEKGYIKGTCVKYTESGNSVEGKTLSNNPQIDTIRPKIVLNKRSIYDSFSAMSREMSRFSDDDDECFGGADPYTMFY